MKNILTLLRTLVLLPTAAFLFACQEPVIDEPDPDPIPEGPAPEVELTVSAGNLVFSSCAGSQEARVSTNQDTWTATVSGTGSGWISVVPENDALTVSVSENTGMQERRGTVTVSAGGRKTDISVRQDGAQALPAGGENMKLSYTLADNTVVAPKAFADYVIASDEKHCILTLRKDIPKELIPAFRTNLVINTPTSVLPGGLLGRVGEIEETDDGYLLPYSPINLTEAFKDLDMNMEEVDLNEYVTRVEDADGNEVTFTRTRATASLPLHIDLPAVGWDLPLGFSLTPKMGLDLQLKMQLIVGDYKISTLTFKVDMAAEIGADLELALDGSVEKYFKLMTLYFAALPVGPVVLTPGVDLYAVVGADGKIGLTASASTVLHTSAELHYDEINGLSGECSAGDPEPGETKYSAGPTIEAGFSYGLGVGPSIGVYTDVIQAGITMNLRRREALSTSLDLISLLNDPDDRMTMVLYRNAELSIKWEVNAALHLRAFGLSKDFTAPSIGLGGDKYKVFPPFADDFAVIPEGNGYRFQSWVTGPSLLPGYAGDPLGEMALKISDPQRPLQDKYVSFDLTEARADALWNDPNTPQPVEASVSGLESGRTYIAELCWKMGDNTICLKPLGRIVAVDNRMLAAIRGILSDVKSCAANQWEGCNWDDADIPINKYANVYFVGSSEGDQNYLWMQIDLPDEWRLGRDLRVENHSAGVASFSWTMHPSVLEFDTITIEDVNFSGFTQRGTTTARIDSDMKVKTYIDHSPRSFYYPDTVTEKLDMSGSGIRSIAEYHAIPEILVDDCLQLESISLSPDVGETIRTFSAKNCPALTAVWLNGDINVTPAQVEEMTSAVANAGNAMGLGILLDTPRTFNTLTVGKGVSSLHIRNIGSLVLSGAADLESVLLEGHASSLSVSDCARLEELLAPDIGLESFSISGTPMLKWISIYDNPRLTMVVPAVFDQIRNAGGKVKYDVRYEYQTLSGGIPYFVDDYGKTWYRATGRYYYYDTGHGFYYADEPGRGYHLKD